MKLRELTSIIAATAVALLHTSCGGDEKQDGGGKPDAGERETASAQGAGALAEMVSATAPEGALGVVDARAAAKPGEPIVLRGKVGGKVTPISDSLAILVLADEKAITSCDEIPGDECPNPWDYCCEESAKIAASTATIQVKGEDGKLLRTTLRGLGDLKELSHLVVSGTVDPASTADALIVNAAMIHVEKP